MHHYIKTKAALLVMAWPV